MGKIAGVKRPQFYGQNFDMAILNSCPHCNHTNRPTATFCSQCGATLASQLAPSLKLHGRYTIIRQLGKGGMGALYLASETIARKKRPVVLKEMLEYFDPNDPRGQVKAIKRFEAEAATLASLNIHGIPQVFDFFSEGGRNFIIMQFVEGENLEQKLTHFDENANEMPGKTYTVDEVLSWGIQLCKVLENLAAENVIHMDIKPANLIVDKAGEIWLVDFGTAKAHQSPMPGGTSGRKKSSIFGTVGYAPPEQAIGKPESRSDVFALAATLYHLLTDDDPRDQPYKFPKLHGLPKSTRKALQRALIQDVNKRISAKEFRQLLGAQPSHGPVFRWRDGTFSYTPEDLASTANRNWEEARMYFKGDEWERWFKDLHRHDILAKVKNVKTREDNLDLALDTFLRQLDPTLPQPHLVLPNTSMHAGDVPWQKQKTIELEVTNAGGGCLQCKVSGLSPGLQAKPTELVIGDSRRIKVTVDAGVLSPSPQPQVLYLTIDAGKAGRKQVPIMVNVPEPGLEVRPPILDIGRTYRGDIQSCTFTVSNQGGSAFLGKITCDTSWGSVEPEHFLCSPGRSYQVKYRVDTSKMRVGGHSGQLRVIAKAEDWEYSQRVPVKLSISVLQNIRKYWARPLLWMFGWVVYGIFLGALLGTWSGGVAISGPAYAIITGVLFGTLICVLLPTIIGTLGGFGRVKGRDGARLGAIIGLAPGVIIGGLAGLLGARFLDWLGLSLTSVVGMGFYGAIVGGLSCVVLGLVTWWVAENY